MDYTGKRVIKSLFEAFRNEKFMLPKDIQSRINQDMLGTCICDYLAGLTDKSAIELYQKLFLPLSL